MLMLFNVLTSERAEDNKSVDTSVLGYRDIVVRLRIIRWNIPGQGIIMPKPVLVPGIIVRALLIPAERFWRDHRKWGYIPKCGKLKVHKCLVCVLDDFRRTIGDDTRASDGTYVTLKVVGSSIGIHEAEIATFLSFQALADPHKHCVPIHETLKTPDDDDKTVLAIFKHLWVREHKALSPSGHT
ncbi:hypothetical protein PILCRDRAFT_91817 [Piloderma croceum F 1598]|uniref:Uncharacterized protein n=1 Tax=Piloderma croceum (strain F 1598) TaxID=765440 RepID=A0A0C3BEZ9_PILCF|nr:hypothetical protein PILCRDRAFT_91817 [Piloderma croceum F 1598]